MYRRTIRDFERSGKLAGIVEKAHSANYYEYVDRLKWVPVSEQLPVDGQRVIACKHNDFECWLDVVYYADGMFFDDGWMWADEATDYDAWMPMPLPMIRNRKRSERND